MSPASSTRQSTRNCSPRRSAWPSPTTRRGNGRRGTWISTRSRPRRAPTSAARPKIRVVENGPVRVAVEVAREAEGSKFVQTIRLSAGDAGNRVEFGNAIDWRRLASNLKAVFPLSATQSQWRPTTGTSARSSGPPKTSGSSKWPRTSGSISPTRAAAYGATILTDCKNGSDKPDDHTIRLTLMRTPGFRPDATSNAAEATRQSVQRPAQPGLGPSRVRLRPRRARRRLARGPDRLAGVSAERPLIAFESREARRRAGQKLLAC